MGNSASTPKDVREASKVHRAHSQKRRSSHHGHGSHDKDSHASDIAHSSKPTSPVDIQKPAAQPAVLPLTRQQELEKLRNELDYFTMISGDMREEILTADETDTTTHFPVEVAASDAQRYNPLAGSARHGSSVFANNFADDISSDEHRGKHEGARREKDDELAETASLSSQLSSDEVELPAAQPGPGDETYPIKLVWYEPGHKVFVTGTFSGWKTMIPLHTDGDFKSAVVDLEPGTHRLVFVVDGDLKCANHLPTASDSMGNFVNYIEVDPSADEEPGAAAEESGEQTPAVEEAAVQYSSVIPPIFVEGPQSEHLVGAEIVNPPHLPAQLDSCILNSTWTFEKEDQSVLPPPNHTVINHLATTAIKHRVLSVASTSRYSHKSITQVFYAPLPDNL